jgi:hypothetical protein
MASSDPSSPVPGSCIQFRLEGRQCQRCKLQAAPRSSVRAPQARDRSSIAPQLCSRSPFPLELHCSTGCSILGQGGAASRRLTRHRARGHPGQAEKTFRS